MRLLQMLRESFGDSGSLELTISSGRSLTDAEIRDLEQHGSFASEGDWSVVRVGHSERLRPGFCRRCVFAGPVLLCSSGQWQDFVAWPGGKVRSPSGVYDSTLSNVLIETGALVMRCSMVSNTIVRTRAALVDCGFVRCAGNTTYSNGLEIPIGPETGERTVRGIHANMTYPNVVRLATRESPPNLKELSEEEFSDAGFCATVVDSGAFVHSCARILDSYIGPGSIVEGSELQSVTLLSTPEDPCIVQGRSSVKNSLIQEGASIKDGASVIGSFVMEHSEVCLHAKVSGSILAPDCSVGSGECVSSLLGPFVGFHHQSLIIASIWPLGRGNLGYGCNVGSNHTTRRADQEHWPGEGMFFGLSCAIKFPANYSESPYTVIASGVTCLPQRLRFPFSLINSPELSAEHGIAELRGMNELIPAWNLFSNMYMLERNDRKYRSRTKATRTFVGWPIFRKATIDMMVDARHRLRSAKETVRSQSGGVIYFVGEHSALGLGKNFMTERSRTKAIKAYTTHIQRYALTGLLVLLERVSKSGSEEVLTAQDLFIEETRATGEEASGSCLSVLLSQEFGDMVPSEPEYPDLAQVLEKLIAIELEIADSVADCKERDATRGRKIFDSYDEFYSPTVEDSTVQSVRRECEAKAQRVTEVIHGLRVGTLLAHTNASIFFRAG